MGRTKSAFWGTVSSQIYTFIAIVIGMISVPIIVKHLSSNIYGVSVIIFQVTAYIGLFDFGLTAGVERYLANTRNDSEDNKKILNRIISTSLIVYTLIGIIMMISGGVFALFAARIFNVPASYANDIKFIIIIISIIIGLQLVLRAITGIFFAHQRQLLSNTLSFIINITNVILTIVFVYQGCGLWSFAYSQIVVFFINAILNIYYFKKYYPYITFKSEYFDYQLLAEMFSYGFSMFLIGMSVQVIFQTDRVLVGSLLSLTLVSVYSLSTRIPELVTQFIWKITDNSFPAIVEISSQDMAAFVNVHSKLMKITMSLSTVAFWFILCASPSFIGLWVGSQFFAGNDFMLITVYLYLIQHTFIHVSAMCLNGAGIAKKVTYVYIIEAVLNIFASIYFTKYVGLKGVILGTIVSGIVTSVWFVPYLSIKFMKIKTGKYLSDIIKPFIICSPIGVLSFFLNKHMLKIDSWFHLILFSLVFALLNLPGIWFLNKDLFNVMLNKVKLKRAS